MGNAGSSSDHRHAHPEFAQYHTAGLNSGPLDVLMNGGGGADMGAPAFVDMNSLFRALPKMMMVADDMHRMTNYIEDLRNILVGVVAISAIGVLLFALCFLMHSRRKRRHQRRSYKPYVEEGGFGGAPPPGMMTDRDVYNAGAGLGVSPHHSSSQPTIGLVTRPTPIGYMAYSGYGGSHMISAPAPPLDAWLAERPKSQYSQAQIDLNEKKISMGDSRHESPDHRVYQNNGVLYKAGDGHGCPAVVGVLSTTNAQGGANAATNGGDDGSGGGGSPASQSAGLPGRGTTSFSELPLPPAQNLSHQHLPQPALVAGATLHQGNAAPLPNGNALKPRSGDSLGGGGSSSRSAGSRSTTSEAAESGEETAPSRSNNNHISASTRNGSSERIPLLDRSTKTRSPPLNGGVPAAPLSANFISNNNNKSSAFFRTYSTHHNNNRKS